MNNTTGLKEAFTEKARELALQNIDKAWEQTFGHTFTDCEQPASDLVDQNKRSRFEKICFNFARPAYFLTKNNIKIKTPEGMVYLAPYYETEDLMVPIFTGDKPAIRVKLENGSFYDLTEDNLFKTVDISGTDANSIRSNFFVPVVIALAAIDELKETYDYLENNLVDLKAKESQDRTAANYGASLHRGAEALRAANSTGLEDAAAFLAGVFSTGKGRIWAELPILMHGDRDSAVKNFENEFPGAPYTTKVQKQEGKFPNTFGKRFIVNIPKYAVEAAPDYLTNRSGELTKKSASKFDRGLVNGILKENGEIANTWFVSALIYFYDFSFGKAPECAPTLDQLLRRITGITEEEATDWFNTGVAAVTGGDTIDVEVDDDEALHLDFPEPDTTPLVTDLSDWQRD